MKMTQNFLSFVTSLNQFLQRFRHYILSIDFVMFLCKSFEIFFVFIKKIFLPDIMSEIN